jgi:hypothetical protein
MTYILDAWHDRYHGGAPDYVKCPYCQDELLDNELIIIDEDRLEDKEL